MGKKLITVFTPTFNRAHTIVKTYQSLCTQTCNDFEWLIVDDGSTDNTEEIVEEWIKDNVIPIKYYKKENGGLHTGYNIAIANIDTELNICIDSDDFMPDNAIEIIKNTWEKNKNSNLAGIIGLDYFAGTNTPVGGIFSDISKPIHFTQISPLLKHYGDTKMVLRTDLVKPLVPMQSFPGEKNFNPIYLYFKIDPKLNYLLINENLCFVDYQPSGMSAGIFRQYFNSPRSFAQIRYEELKHPLISLKRKVISAAHLVSSSIIVKDFNLLRKSPQKVLTIISLPLGIAIYLYIYFKSKINDKY